MMTIGVVLIVVGWVLHPGSKGLPSILARSFQTILLIMAAALSVALVTSQTTLLTQL